MADAHADLNAELRRRARAGTVTLDLGDGEGTPQGAGLRGAHERLEAARATGDPARIEEAETAMDAAVREWRAARRAEGEGADGGTPQAARLGAGAGGARSRAAPSMTDRLRADKLGVPVSTLPTQPAYPEPRGTRCCRLTV